MYRFNFKLVTYTYTGGCVIDLVCWELKLGMRGAHRGSSKPFVTLASPRHGHTFAGVHKHQLKMLVG